MTIYEKMLVVADKDSLPENHILRIRANELKAAIEGPSDLPSPKALLGKYARAKKAFSEYTGKPLIEPSAVEAGARLLTFLSSMKEAADAAKKAQR
jgi:hypothetical protein